MINEFLLENTWIKIDVSGDIPCPRTGHSACSYKEEFMYIFGGYSDQDVMNDMYRLEILTKVSIYIFAFLKNLKKKKRIGLK